MSIVGEPFHITNTESWTAEGLCRQVGMGLGDLWFPVKGQTLSVQRSKKICLECPVIDECLDYAIQNNERHGIWGGKSELERRKIRHQLGVPPRTRGKAA